MTKIQNSKKSFKFAIQMKDTKSRARAGIITTPHGIVETPCFVPVGTKATVKGLTPQDLKECGVQLLFGNTYHLHLRPGEEVVEKFGGLAQFMNWNGPTITDSGGFQVFSLGAKRRGRLTHVTESTRRLSHVENDAQKLSRKFVTFSPSSLSERRLPKKEKYSNTLSESAFSSFSSGQASRLDDDVALFVKITDDGVKFRSHIDGSLHEFTPEKSIEIQKNWELILFWLLMSARLIHLLMNIRKKRWKGHIGGVFEV